jgi:hypothetical protein
LHTSRATLAAMHRETIADVLAVLEVFHAPIVAAAPAPK